MSDKEIINAMRASHIPEGINGDWSIVKSNGCAGRTTELKHRCSKVPCKIVMHDGDSELEQLLPFINSAFGNVVISGLGLGCLPRGLLLNEKVKSITVVEKYREVTQLVLGNNIPFNIIHSDALEFFSRNDFKYDCAWHDIFSFPGQRKLEELHSDLLNLTSHSRINQSWNPEYKKAS